MKINRAGIELLKRWEGCRLKSYQDSVGVWTVGYGLTSAAGLIKVGPGLSITQQQADDYLVQSLVKYESAVTKALTRAPNENQFSAMVSLCYNIGPGAFAGSSVARHFNAGNLQASADAFRLWNKAGGQVLKGLVNRREDERKLFLTPVSKPAPVPPPPDVEPPQNAPQKPAEADPASGVDKATGWVLAAVAAVVAALTVIFMKG